MKQPIVTGALVALGLSIASATALASTTEERFREEGRGMDLTGFFKSENDARSQNFNYNGTHEHAFSVDSAGEYLLESRVPGGQSDDYRVEATLLDDEGAVIARGEGLGQSGGLAMRQRLEPGDYVLRVEGQKYGSKGKQGNSYFITVAGIDTQGNRTNAVSDGEGLFVRESAEGERSAFIRNNDTVAALSAPSAAETPNAPEPATATENPSAPSAPEPAAEPAEPTNAAQTASQDQAFQEIVTDVKIRARGEVLSFAVQEAGTVAITTSTYPSGYEDTYRIELEVRDDAGRVVTRDAGEGFDGDVDLEANLEPGQYRVWVNGQKFGSAMSGVNNYELRIRQLD
ncbi:hypothetical protein [Onishia niordana]|uniref:hypothetical protein n=1 Tax=Onishia niordana TaxID=2508711 RepID=UPI00109F4346|nr:hypothetical protein [Halomonas niordiana]